MEQITTYIKNNYLILIVGMFFYILFLYFNITGNRICDCESTENYKPSTNRSSINHFYHK